MDLISAGLPVSAGKTVDNVHNGIYSYNLEASSVYSAFAKLYLSCSWAAPPADDSCAESQSFRLFFCDSLSGPLQDTA